MLTDIHIASHLRDLPYLRHNLRSIKKFATGFNKVVLAVPIDDLNPFLDVAAEFECKLWTYNRHEDSNRWQLHAQAVKCLADIACDEADYILHTDSDCIFIGPVTPEDYLVGGKPVMLYQSYKDLPTCPWQAVVEHALGRPVEFEFMRRHPQVNPRGVYADLRLAIGVKHGKPIETWVLDQKPTFPWGFTEHNTIGAFAWYSPEWHDKYHWIDLAKEPRPTDKLMQFWSHSPPDREQDSPTGAGKIVPLNLINQILQ